MRKEHFPPGRAGMALPEVPPVDYSMSHCAGTNCPSLSNCQRFTPNLTNDLAALHVRREAGATACDRFLPIKLITTFKEDY